MENDIVSVTLDQMWELRGDNCLGYVVGDVMRIEAPATPQGWGKVIKQLAPYYEPLYRKVVEGGWLILGAAIEDTPSHWEEVDGERCEVIHYNYGIEERLLEAVVRQMDISGLLPP